MANDDKTTGLQAVIEDLAREFNDKINDDDIPPEMFSTAFTAMRTLYRCIQRCQRELEREQYVRDAALERVLDALDAKFQAVKAKCPIDAMDSTNPEDHRMRGRLDAYATAYNIVLEILEPREKTRWTKGETDE
ncbi:hypothetical protein [Bifidobacterium apri]|uniref:Uncharacterized protein n=1 Tax=Bifidobacterium apri TaxID=1769423 RepID=A0A6A2W1W8_9BIFI|nr:hypothetical protein [Bifidobacterium apri]KAB8291522.1 hypothetical protein DSM100238_1839 [Bifidobacterium apri]